MIEKIIEIEFSEGEGLQREEYKGTVTLRKLNSGEFTRYRAQSANTSYIGKTPKIESNFDNTYYGGVLVAISKQSMEKTTYYEDKVSKNIVPTTSSFVIDWNTIRTMPYEITDQLYNAFQEMHGLTEKKNSTLEKPSEESQYQTQT